MQPYIYLGRVEGEASPGMNAQASTAMGQIKDDVMSFAIFSNFEHFNYERSEELNTLTIRS